MAELAYFRGAEGSDRPRSRGGIRHSDGLGVAAADPRHAVAGLAKPPGHKDPFGELLLVLAQEERMLLLTRDAKLTGHPLVLSAA